MNEWYCEYPGRYTIDIVYKPAVALNHIKINFIIVPIIPKKATVGFWGIIYNLIKGV